MYANYFLIVNVLCIFGLNIRTCALSTLGRSKNFLVHEGEFKIHQHDVTKSTTVPTKKPAILRKCDPCPKGIRCVPSIQCPAILRMDEKHRPQRCDLPHSEGHGFCCTTGHYHTSMQYHESLKHHRPHGHTITDSQRSAHDSTHDMLVNQKILRNVIEEARSQFGKMLQNENQYRQPHLQRGHPEFMHHMVFRSPAHNIMRSVELTHNALEQIFASRLYKNRQHISSEFFELNEVPAYLEGTIMENTCNPPITCPIHPLRYRNQDGMCNNPIPGRGLWGATNAPMEHLLPPSYEDGIWEPRTYSIDGTHLPNARTISRSLLEDVDRPHPIYNLLLMQFGQFITHDVSHSSSITTADGQPVSCCMEDGSAVIPPAQMHYSCLPIEIEPGDDMYEQYGQGCMNLVRSALAPDSQCKLSYGKQLSKVTHYLDASTIYGSDLKTQSKVRNFIDGKIRMFDDFGRDLLPLTFEKDACNVLENGPCFFAGDARDNQIISLTAIHILFGREHNRIAHILGQLNPHWDDEKLFYETQRIVIAKLQIIVYKEWLPLVIGREMMQQFGLNIRDFGYTDDYDVDVNAAITSEFSTAAMRYGHSIVDGKYIIKSNEEVREIIEIPEVMFNPGRLRQRHFYDAIWRSMTEQPMQQFDSAITKGLSGFLFRGSNPFGLDLAAINVQRGRDHGIRPYNDYLQASGNSRIRDFHEFGFEAAGKLAQMYKHPDDVDLWIGGLFESAVPDAIVGPTFANIIADQFSRFRRGDRYFVEHGPNVNPGHFNPQQLNELRRTTMARIICDNGDNIQMQSANAFMRIDVPGNSLLQCSDPNLIPALNYDLWKE